MFYILDNKIFRKIRKMKYLINLIAIIKNKELFTKLNI